MGCPLVIAKGQPRDIAGNRIGCVDSFPAAAWIDAVMTRLSFRNFWALASFRMLAPTSNARDYSISIKAAPRTTSTGIFPALSGKASPESSPTARSNRAQGQSEAE
jgi:hypothetical protein